LPLALRGEHIKHVACGGGHTGVVSNEGRVWCFGRGRDGQLGRADQRESPVAIRTTPVEVIASTKLDGKHQRQRVHQLSLGDDHSVALVSLLPTTSPTITVTPVPVPAVSTSTFPVVSKATTQ
jgi:alpha-tubulin suppressor-like RCC1 family protein